MCKVGAITGINDENRKSALTFMKCLGHYMSQFNDDGLGYAAFDKSGQIFGEKWLDNYQAFLPPHKRKFKKADYKFFGEKVKRHEMKSMILHTRLATCTKNIQNAHPFVDNADNPSIALIHNGVISNDDKLTKKFSTCDSEVILHEYDKYQVASDVENIQSVANELMGWYTCCVLTKDENGREIIDFFTDNGRLASAWIKEINCRVYSTSVQDIRLAAKLMKFKVRKVYKFKPDSYRRVDANSGEIISFGKFDSMAAYPIDIRYATGTFEDWDKWLNQSTNKHKRK